MTEGPSNTREKLLEALDSEIEHAQASLSSSGRSRWALTLSLSALLWLAIQVSIANDLEWRRAVLLALSLTVAWDFIENLSRAIDASLLTLRSKGGKFIALSRFLAAWRSILLYAALRRAAMFWAVFWIAVPEMSFLKYYFAAGLLGLLLGFVLSLIDSGPTSIEDVQSKSWIRASNAITNTIGWLARIAAVVSCGVVIYRTHDQFTATEIRMGIILAAFAYLLTELVEDRIPATHMNALRTVRQNLAFERVSIEDAKKELDILLFAGGSAVATMQHSPDSLLAQAAQIRALYEQADVMLPRYQELIAELSQPQLPFNRHEYEATHATLEKLRDQADAEYTRLLKRVGKLQNQIKVMAFFSSSTARELEPLVAKLRAAFEPIELQRKSLGAALASKLKILPPQS